MGVVTCGLIFSCGVAAIGSGFQHGYNAAIINTPKKVMEEWLNLCMKHPGKTKIETWWSLAASIFCIGGIIGGLTSSIFSTILGRRGALFLNNFIAILASALMALAKTFAAWQMFFAGRFIVGVNCGINSGLATMYCVEISPTSMRGALGTLYQLIITISILIAQVFGSKHVFGTEPLWPVLFWIVGGVAIAQAVLLLLCPESPKHLLAKEQEEKAAKALKRLRGKDDVSDEIDEIKTEAAEEKAAGKVGIKEFFSNPMLRKPLIVSVLLMVAQQLSGINAVIYYSTDTFIKAGLKEDQAQIATMMMGAASVLMTVVSLFLVEVFGRKTLLIAGFGSMLVDTLFLCAALNFTESSQIISYLSMGLVVMFVVCFAIGPGSIPWFIVCEMFGQDARPFAASMAAGTNWIANFIVGQTFLLLQSQLKAFVFLIFVFFQMVFTIYIIFMVPETKNKKLEEVLEFFK